MSTDGQGESGDGSTPKRTRNRSILRMDAKANGGAGPKKIKMSFSLDDATAKRLAIHAAMTGIDRAEVVARLINEHLRSYRVQTINGNESANDASEGGKRLPVA